MIPISNFPLIMKCNLIIEKEEFQIKIIFNSRNFVIKFSLNDSKFHTKKFNTIEKFFFPFFLENSSTKDYFINYTFIKEIFLNDLGQINLIITNPKKNFGIFLIFTNFQKNNLFSRKINPEILRNLLIDINGLIKIERKLFFENFLNFMKNIFTKNSFFENAIYQGKIYYEKSNKEFLLKEKFNKNFKKKILNENNFDNKNENEENFGLEKNEDFILIEKKAFYLLQKNLEIFILMNLKIKSEKEINESDLFFFKLKKNVFAKEIKKENNISFGEKNKKNKKNNSTNFTDRSKGRKKFEINFNLFDEIDKEKDKDKNNENSPIIKRSKIRFNSIILDSVNKKKLYYIINNPENLIENNEENFNFNNNNNTESKEEKLNNSNNSKNEIPDKEEEKIVLITKSSLFKKKIITEKEKTNENPEKNNSPIKSNFSNDSILTKNSEFFKNFGIKNSFIKEENEKNLIQKINKFKEKHLFFLNLSKKEILLNTIEFSFRKYFEFLFEFYFENFFEIQKDKIGNLKIDSIYNFLFYLINTKNSIFDEEMKKTFSIFFEAELGKLKKLVKDLDDLDKENY